MKKLIVGFIPILLGLTLSACGKQSVLEPQTIQSLSKGTQSNSIEPLPPPIQKEASQAFDTRTSDAGSVVIDVTPINLTSDVWDFEVDFNTHSVDLSFDVTDVSVLRCDKGQEYSPAAWEGSEPGGHHRSGTLKFAALDHPTTFVEIVILDVAKEPERIFRWDINSSEETSLAEVTIPSSLNQENPPVDSNQTDAGPAYLVLSGQEFFFGDVVMSIGTVSQTIDITNKGSGILVIEETVPT